MPSAALIHEHHLETIYEPTDLITTDSEFPFILIPCNPLKPCYSLPRQGVRRHWPGHVLQNNLGVRGYPQIDFGWQSSLYHRLIHILRYRNHVGPIPVGLTVNHWDSDKTNSNIFNLHLLLVQENLIHGQLTGHRTPSTSGYYGVMVTKPQSWFLALARIGTKQTYIPQSRSKDPRKSALVYTKFVILHRLPCLLNPELLTLDQEAIL